MNFIVKNPDFKKTIEHHLTNQEFMKHIGCRLTTIEPGYVVAEIDLTKIHKQQIGLVHGGVTATIADVAAGFAGFTLVGPDEHTVTAEIKISYFSPGLGKTLKAVGRVVKPGRNMHFCEAEVFTIDESGVEKLIAKATTTMAVITPQKHDKILKSF
ncbi:MAG: PaaI family thioesterase [Bacteroidota bacterium]